MSLNFIQNFYFPEPILQFLNKDFIQGVTWLDTWLIIHFFMGVAIITLLLILIKRKLTKPELTAFIITALIIIGFELFEFYLATQGLAIKDTFGDIIADIIVGLSGAILPLWIMKRK